MPSVIRHPPKMPTSGVPLTRSQISESRHEPGCNETLLWSLLKVSTRHSKSVILHDCMNSQGVSLQRFLLLHHESTHISQNLLNTDSQPPTCTDFSSSHAIHVYIK